MPRAPKPTDFTVPVEDIGTFTFASRTMRDEIALQVEFARMIDGVEPTEWLRVVCGWMAAFKVLTVRAPEGWDLDTLDPLDQDTYVRMKRVYDALTEKERSFRPGSGAAGEAGGQAAG